MKAIFYCSVLVVVLFLFVLYVLIPSPLTIKETVVIRSPERAAEYFLSKEGWHTWWPDFDKVGHADTSTRGLTYKDALFSFFWKKYSAVAYDTRIGTARISGTLKFTTVDADSIIVEWISLKGYGVNPVTRLSDFIASRKLGAYKNEILAHLKAHLENERNIYGISIEDTEVRDTLFLTTKFITTGWPSNENIYALIAKLRDHISLNGAREANKPIYNITKVNPNTYQTMVGIAINKTLPEGDSMEIKRMIKADLLTAEVKGGNSTVDRAVKQLELYIQDKKLSSPAIPFSMLVTDRTAEADSSRWVTRIYYPVY